MSETLLDDPALRIELDESGIMRAIIVGAIAEESLERLVEAIHQVIRANAPVLHLIDGDGFDLTNLHARWELSQLMKRNQPYVERSAIVTKRPHARFFGQVLLRASGRRNVKFFATELEAVDWLLETRASIRAPAVGQ